MFRFIILFLFPLIVFATPPSAKFDGGEHVLMGNEVVLSFPNEAKPRQGYVFNLPSGAQATYGDLISLGDLYGIVSKPIALGKTENERQQRFIEAFSTFAFDKKVAPETMALITILNEEAKIIRDGVGNGRNPDDIYAEIGDEISRKLNCATGGSCQDHWWLVPGRYLRLASTDFDHFGKNAWLAYQAGHEVAMQTARSAHQSQSRTQLELAYMMNAFASHFLSDIFSSGHIRTPRYELYLYTTPSLSGSALSHFMHKEENLYGLHVHNLRGDKWFAYGDHGLFKPGNRQNRALLQEALQRSVNQIYYVYLTGYIVNKDEVFDIIPLSDETENASNRDISPLFYWDKHKQKLYRRLDMDNVYDKHWTSNWWAWSTLAYLSKNRGVPLAFADQSDLSNSPSGAVKPIK